MATSTFSDPFLITPGEPPIPWRRWIRMFETFMVASGASEFSPDRKKSLLLYSLGREGQRLVYASNSEEKIAATKYEEILELLAIQFMPKVNVVAERFKFRKREQFPGESVDNYVAALRELASTCNFKSMENEMIRDQFIEKTAHQRIRERLLLETYSLDKAIEIARQLESGMKEAKLLSESKVEIPDCTESIQVVSSKNSLGKVNQKCFCCGLGGHFAKNPNCPALNAVCRKCNKKGHFERVCRSVSQIRRISTTANNEDMDKFSSPQILKVGDQPNKMPYLNCQVLVNGKPLFMVIDTGAAVSILNEKLYKRHFSEFKLQPATVNLVNYDHSNLEVKGCFNTSLTYNDKTIDCNLYIANGPSLLGLDIFKALGLQIESKGVQTVKMDDTEGLLQEFNQLFEGIGCATKFQHRSELLSEAVPVAHKARPIPFALQEELDQEINALLDEGIIEKIGTADWISPIVLTKRKNGKIRLCVDLRSVNQNIVQMRYPLPNIETLLASVKDANYVTKLDLKSAYHQLPLHEDTKKLMAFTTPLGNFRYCRGTFGLSDMPGSFQRMMDIILAGCEGALWFLDDIIVVSATKEQHLQRLKEVFTRLSDNGLTLNKEKCVFCAEELEWLGVKISSKGISMLPDNIKAIEEIREPKDVTELRSLLGLLNHYAKFLPPKYSELIEPVRKLTRAETPWVWGEEQKECLQKVKSQIIKPPVLAFFNPKAETFVTTDASVVGLGAELSQRQEDGTIRPVAFASRTLSTTERKYSIGELEALACIWACEKWDRYLMGKPFVLITDHKSLVTLLQSSEGNGCKPLRLARWSARLLRYTFRVVYKSSTQNVVADALSRLPIPTPVSDESMDDEAAICSILSQPLAILPEQLSKETISDPVLKQVVDILQTKWPERKEIPKEILPYYNIRNELYLWGDQCIGRGTRAVIPASLQGQVLQLIHEGHFGIVKCKQRMRALAWWPKVDEHCESFVRNCIACANSDKSASQSTVPLKPTPFPDSPWKELSIDIMGPIESAPRGFRYLVVLHDFYSKWPEALASDNVDTKVITDFLQNRFATWGVPEKVVSDNGPQFISEEFESFMKVYGIEHKPTPIYSPQSNGAVERLNQTIKNLLQVGIKDGLQWRENLSNVLLAIRSTPHSTTKESPFKMMTGREMRVKLSALQPTGVQGKEVQRTDAVRKRVVEVQKKSKDRYDARFTTKANRFKKGDIVRIKLPSRQKKLASKYSDPIRVEDVTQSTVTTEDRKKWHANRIVPYFEREHIETDKGIPWFPNNELQSDRDIASRGTEELNGRELRPRRVRRPPEYLRDYVVDMD